MSKDGKDVAPDSDAPRRRRKGGGLRVPSDNVPRPSAPEIGAQPSEDPQLAVSVAYAFADERGERGDATIVDEPADHPREEGTGESVDIDVDDFEELEGSYANDDEDEVEDAGPETVAEVELPSLGTGTAEAAAAGRVATPIASDPASAKWPRSRTEALSDTDLEHMVIRHDSATVNLEDAELHELDEDDIPTRVSEGSGRAPRLTDPAPLIEEVGDADSEEIAAVAAPADSQDSAEILTDEMLEELEGASSPAATMELSGAEIEEVAAETKKPPPAPPAGSAAAPAPAAAPAKAARKSKPWFEQIFDEDYLRTLPFLTPQSTQAEANFVIESLAAGPGAQVLDVGCGYGRHAMELAARGYHVVGLDSSLPLLLRGADEAQRRGLNINFVHGDMRELTFDSQFDGAYCLFSTFGYFDDETNKKTAQNIARALKPGARFIIEILNRDYIIGDLPSRVWWEGDGCVVLEEVEFNYFSSRILSHRSVVFDDGRQLEQEISIRGYSLHELGKLLHAAGFRVIEVSGGMHNRGRFFGGRSRDIVVVAERRPPKDRAAKRATTEVGIGPK